VQAAATRDAPEFKDDYGQGRLDQPQLCQFAYEPWRQHVAVTFEAVQIGWRVLFIKIAPSLMCAARSGLDGNQTRLELDVPTSVVSLLKAKDRRSSDDGVLHDPVKRSAFHLLMASGQVTSGQERLSFMAFKPAAQRLGSAGSK